MRVIPDALQPDKFQIFITPHCQTIGRRTHQKWDNGLQLEKGPCADGSGKISPARGLKLETQSSESLSEPRPNKVQTQRHSYGSMALDITKVNKGLLRLEPVTCAVSLHLAAGLTGRTCRSELLKVLRNWSGHVEHPGHFATDVS